MVNYDAQKYTSRDECIAATAFQLGGMKDALLVTVSCNDDSMYPRLEKAIVKESTLGSLSRTASAEITISIGTDTL